MIILEFLKVENLDIQRLTDRQITELLSMLLYFEAEKFGIPTRSVEVALNITVPDGGEDARIQWKGGRDKTNWLPNRFTLFQCKATDMPPSKCRDELLTKNGCLKPRVKEVFDNGGSYILFHNRTVNKGHQIERITAFKKAIDESDYIGNSLDVDIHIYDACKIAAWTNESISAIVAVWKWVGKLLPNGARTWKDWSGYQDNNYEYVLDDKIKSYIFQLRSHLNGIRKVARIIGLSGVGKTRLAFETYRQPEDPLDIEQKIRSSQVIYLDAAINSSELPSVISTWRIQGLRGTIIVDNCTPDMHEKLKYEIEHTKSQLNLLTLDFNPERYNSDHPYIELSHTSNEVIKGIISQGYPGISKEDIERIVDFAQGFPKIAVLLAQARINKDEDIGSLRDNVLMEKLLWGRGGRDNLKHKVISVCALFEHLGFEGDVAVQRKFISENICRISDEDFYEECQYFIKRGILDVRGRFVRVTPIPLAIRLATDWWEKCTPERAYEIITSDMPVGMAEALCDQMAKLHFLPKAQELTLNLCGPQAPFGQAEVLNSEKGSRLFRSLVEVNPQATADTLRRVFGHIEREELLKVGPGRRNLIWALEKLCFWEDTFETAAQILLSFAAAENESWGNNATSQFLQLFHFVLSGTQATPVQRIKIIDYALQSRSLQEQMLGIEALGHALQTHHFSRMAGVEIQGSRPVQEDWRPKTWDEVFDYWKKSLEKLTDLAVSNEHLTELACEKIADSIRGLVSYGRMDELEVALKLIIDKKGAFWPNALSNIRDTIRFEGPKMPGKEKERLQKWCNWLQPDNFKEQLILKVSLPQWEHEEDPVTGRYIDISAEKVKIFAIQTLENYYSELVQCLPEILVGEQRQGYTYGYELGRTLEEPEGLLNATILSLKELVSQNVETVNFTFFGGLLASLQNRDQKIVKRVLNEISQSRELSKYTVEIIRFINISEEDLFKVIQLIKEKRVNVSAVNTLSYGSVLSHLSPEVIIEFISLINKNGIEGLLVGWRILFMYTHEEQIKFLATADAFSQMILTPGFLTSGKADNYEVGVVLKKLFHTKAEETDELVKILTTEIISSLYKKINFDQIRNLRKYLGILLEHGWQYAWPILSSALLSDEKVLVYNVIDLLEPDMSYKKWLLPMIPFEVLKLWTIENTKGPEVLSAIVPVIQEGNDNIISPIAEFLVSEFGECQQVLNNISSRLSFGGWSGSAIPHYENQISIYKLFENHASPRVRSWATNYIKGLTVEIQREKQREEENELGF